MELCNQGAKEHRLIPELLSFKAVTGHLVQANSQKAERPKTHRSESPILWMAFKCISGCIQRQFIHRDWMDVTTQFFSLIGHSRALLLFLGLLFFYFKAYKLAPWYFNS